MSKFKVGDKVKVVSAGMGCSSREIGKIYKVRNVGGCYCGGEGIYVDGIDNSDFGDGSIGIKSFILVEIKKVFGIVAFTKEYYK